MSDDDLGAPLKAGGKPAPEVKVVDRRWWARDSEAGGAGASTPLKPTYVEELEQQIAEKERLLQGYLAKYREASAEFDQARARMRREVLKDAERGRRAIFEALLEVVDNLDRAIEAGRTAHEGDALLSGVEMVRRQFLAKLESFGVTRLDPLGTPFDPAQHEALATVPTDTPAQDGLIVGVLTSGYMIGNEVLRPASVAVARIAEGTP